jgi:hypothetical protein
VTFHRAGDRAARADRLPDGAAFALLLTHDVDRPYKRWQAPYFAARNRRPSEVFDVLPWRQPWWRFDDVARVEREAGVRSAFYFLRERSLLDRPLADLRNPTYWVEGLGRYDPSDPAVRGVIDRLVDGGWEVGLHGSYDSYREPDRLAAEYDRLAALTEAPVVGGRQHHLNLDRPATWRAHRAAGLRYDASLGSATEVGFAHGYGPRRPLDDDFLAVPTAVMDKALPDPGAAPAEARAALDDVLCEARETAAVVAVLWHPRTFDDGDFPGHRDLYRWLLGRTADLGGWAGPPRAVLDWFG